MVNDEQRTGAEIARDALLDHLLREWPSSVDVDAMLVTPEATATDFFEACTTLQNDGLIMYEALLLGVSSSPKLLAAALTRKGQEVFSRR